MNNDLLTMIYRYEHEFALSEVIKQFKEYVYCRDYHAFCYCPRRRPQQIDKCNDYDEHYISELKGIQGLWGLATWDSM